MDNALAELLSELRRNFPFYSPRYIAHQLSDVSIPAFAGLLAGTLYNPNNVTPEAAPVTVDLEIDATGQILKMLGYSAPPTPPSPGETQLDTRYDEYLRSLRSEFGWAHITSGGTVANIEALWVARNVRYFPLAVKRACEVRQVELTIKLPSMHGTDESDIDIRECEDLSLLLLKPNESIYLRSRFVDAIRKAFSLSTEEAACQADTLLAEADFGLEGGFFKAAAKYPPAILVSGTAHYSIQKAADLLGIGRSNVVLVDSDENFRVSVEDLEKQYRNCLKRGMFPIAVVAVAGTTEEGAVDPIHEILELRTKLEKENMSFWLHIDAAWAGYFRTIFQIEDNHAAAECIAKISKKLDLPTQDMGKLCKKLEAQLVITFKSSDEVPSHREDSLHRLLRKLRVLSEDGPTLEFLRVLKTVVMQNNNIFQDVEKNDFRLSLDDRVEIARRYTSEKIELRYGDYKLEETIGYLSPDVCKSFIGFGKAESITVDPHKMGYTGYPCGIVAFKNDRVRHFVMQHAPYITGATHNALVHYPPKHLKPDGKQVSVDAFAPFILEGSKPGSAACALHLATKVLPLTMVGHGAVIKASILAAQELWEWLAHWPKISRANEIDCPFDFVTLGRNKPDTNIVVFSIKRKYSYDLENMNELTDKVYESFSILTELGDREYSYAQPFFLSATTCKQPSYSFDSMKDFLSRGEFRNPQKQYNTHGVRVLRATLMNPYIAPMRAQGVQQMLGEFMKELVSASMQAARDTS